MKIKVRLNNFEREYDLRSLGELPKYNGNFLVGYTNETKFNKRLAIAKANLSKFTHERAKYLVCNDGELNKEVYNFYSERIANEEKTIHMLESLRVRTNNFLTEVRTCKGLLDSMTLEKDNEFIDVVDYVKAPEVSSQYVVNLGKISSYNILESIIRSNFGIPQDIECMLKEHDICLINLLITSIAYNEDKIKGLVWVATFKGEPPVISIDLYKDYLLGLNEFIKDNLLPADMHMYKSNKMKELVCSLMVMRKVVTTAVMKTFLDYTDTSLMYLFGSKAMVGYIDKDMCKYDLENMNLEIYIRNDSDSTITVFNKSLNVSKLM